MKHTYFSCVILSSFLAWSARFEAIQEGAEKALILGQIKKAEELYTNFLKNADADEANFTKMQLAIVYYKDQEHERAFATFLEALKEAKTHQFPIASNESQSYHLALKMYLENGGQLPEETAQKIVNEYGSIYEKNPQFHHLGYILAVSYANLGHYDQFFQEFYKSYLNDPDHFLAFKTKATLHVKLFERAKTEAQREEQRTFILYNAQRAVELQPQDSSLYRMILAFTPEESKAKVLSTYLNKIIENSIVVPRIDILYYIEIAIAFEQYDLAQTFLNKAKDWYTYSRVIKLAQQHLDEKKVSDSG